MHAPGIPIRKSRSAYGKPEESAAALLRTLRPLALLQMSPEGVSASSTNRQRGTGPRYTMHPLVREIAAEMLQVGSRKQRLRTYRAFVSYMQVQGEALNLCRMDVEAFSQLLSNEQSNMGEVAWVLKELGNEGIVEAQCLRSCERLAEALCAGGSVQQATSLLDSILHLQGSDCPLTARERLLYLLPSQGKVSLAEELAQEMLDRAENAYGGHAESTLGAKFLMADILRLGWQGAAG